MLLYIYCILILLVEAKKIKIYQSGEDNEDVITPQHFESTPDVKKNAVSSANALLSRSSPRPKNCQYCKVEGDIWVYDSNAARNMKERAMRFGKRSHIYKPAERRSSNITKRIEEAEKMIWSTPVIPYVFHKSAGSKVISAVKQAMEDFQTWTCVKFIKRTKEQNYVNITSQNNGCWSELARVGGEQEISLGDFCNNKGSALHELMHTLGFLHEHTRMIRDKAITIMVENIKSRKLEHFDKYPHYLTDKYNLPYDYDSIMNFLPSAFSVNGKPTIMPKNPNIKMGRMGQRTKLSDQDIKLINLVYKCKRESQVALSESRELSDIDNSNEMIDSVDTLNKEHRLTNNVGRIEAQRLPGVVEQPGNIPGKNEQISLLHDLHSEYKPRPQLSESMTELNIAEEKIKDSYESLNNEKSVRPNPPNSVPLKLHTPKGLPLPPPRRRFDSYNYLIG
ncbi:blastula protease 10 isoform X3 [Hydra vulgaris]|uniref:Metalloendopeptidase n=1 Tax=Hydra vulgaris TaxID=6087 RepID=A0ABM4D8S3_HYDVU